MLQESGCVRAVRGEGQGLAVRDFPQQLAAMPLPALLHPGLWQLSATDNNKGFVCSCCDSSYGNHEILPCDCLYQSGSGTKWLWHYLPSSPGSWFALPIARLLSTHIDNLLLTYLGNVIAINRIPIEASTASFQHSDRT